MSTSDAEQKGIDVRQHKRIAQGEKLDGTKMTPTGGKSSGSKSGGLSHASKKNK